MYFGDIRLIRTKSESVHFELFFGLTEIRWHSLELRSRQKLFVIILNTWLNYSQWSKENREIIVMTVTKVKRALTLSTAIVEQYFYSVRDRHVIEESVVIESFFHLVTKKTMIIIDYLHMHFLVNE